VSNKKAAILARRFRTAVPHCLTVGVDGLRPNRKLRRSRRGDRPGRLPLWAGNGDSRRILLLMTRVDDFKKTVTCWSLITYIQDCLFD